MRPRDIALVALVAGAVPVALGTAAIVEYISYSQRGVRAEAVVAGAERLWLRELVYPIPKRSIHRLTYEFRTLDGMPVTGTGVYVQGRGLSAPAEGRKVVVYYLPENRAASYLTDYDTPFDAALFIGFGLLVWGGGGWYARRRWQRQKGG